MTDFKQFSSIVGNEAIDTEKGVIKGVSVITVGKALGHDTWIDATTISQLHDIASKFPDGIKVKLSQAKEHDGSAGQIVGVLKNFRMDGNQERADLHLLKSDGNYSKIIEMAQTMPSEFGLSVVVPNKLEKVDGKNCLRCEDIYSVDIVESPAANKNGLFSSKSNQNDNKNMDTQKPEVQLNALLASIYGLPETATVEEIKAKVVSLSAKPSEVVELSAKLAKLEEANLNSVALAQKTEIDALVAEASRDRKVIPFDNEDLYTSVDGKVTIKMLPSQLSKVISKLTPSVSFSKKPVADAPKGADGKPITDAAARAEFCRTKRAEGAAELTAIINRQAGTFNQN